MRRARVPGGLGVYGDRLRVARSARGINAGPHTGHAMAYDSVRDRVVVFGGRSATTTTINETWEWTPNTWTQLYPLVSPGSLRIDAAAVYEPLRGMTVMFGGLVIGFQQNDTWEWDGAAWMQRSATAPLAIRSSHAMAATRDRVVLFGGIGAFGVFFGDTWEWDGTLWTPRTPLHAPSPRGGHGLAYDSARDRVVLFGGNVGGTLSNDTWEWDGVDWTQRNPAHVPPARTTMTLVYDPVRAQTVLFGGIATAELGDTWVWDGDDWAERSPAMSPPPRTAAGAAFDAARSTVTVFGGSNTDALDDLWEWDGTTWARANVLISPGRHTQHVMAYDNAHSELVMLDNKTWIHRYVSPIYPPDLCEGVDTDGDGLVGCADPDCWGRCTPLCPPRASCDPNAPHCGDGACSPLEDHLLCPIDCPLVVALAEHRQ